MSLQCYVIFHKTLYTECYENLDKSYIEKYIKFIGVNSKIHKTVPATLEPYVVLERTLPRYNPLYQYANFCESSVFYHVYENSLMDPYTHVGFFQYDMIMTNQMFEIVLHLLETHPESNNLIFYHYKENSFRHLNQGVGLQGWSIIIKIYNQLFNSNHTIEEVSEADIPLYHCYILPKDVYTQMMYFMKLVFPYLFEFLNCDGRHLPYHMERCYGIFLQLYAKEKKWIHLKGLTHSTTFKDNWQEVRDREVRDREVRDGGS